MENNNNYNIKSATGNWILMKKIIKNILFENKREREKQ